ncbi:MAG: hypothetical protein E6I61_10185 [Chloroflexi bacterium]|nr:MAG: hypothetical protein E6I71_12680 [Chloroflexota bacterium]TME40050.1 MAG: hypothetical protein E6I61_10185 [Chloroflexota bacterium]TME49425.1 MAG: hypothetical protein E6I53_15925 [Chloroflexota bacterium]
MATGRAQVVRVTLVSAIVVLAAAGGSLLFTETASVTVSVPRQNLEAVATLAGGLGGGALPTERFQVYASESQQGSASTVQVSGRSTQVIQQSDFDAVRNALSVKVTNELGAALYAKSQGNLYVGDSQPDITVTSDHNVGDETPLFTITVSGAIGATAFSERDANVLMLAALKAKVPSGQELTDDPVQFIFQGRQVGPNADVLVTGDDVLVTGKADGYIVPKLSPQSLTSQIRGLSPTDAASSLQRTAPRSRVEIRTSPGAMPLLPVIADHISLTIVVEPARGHF